MGRRCIYDHHPLHRCRRCPESSNGQTFKKILTLGAGILGVATGITLTAATGGLMGTVVLPMMTGAASALIIEPTTKLYTGEDMSMSDVAKKAATYCVLGAITGPIGENLIIFN